MSYGEDLAVGQRRVDVADGKDVMAAAHQGSLDGFSHADVNDDLHESARDAEDPLLGDAIGRVSERGSDIIGLKVGKVVEDLRNGDASCQSAKHLLNADAEASNGGLADENPGINRNSLQQRVARLGFHNGASNRTYPQDITAYCREPVDG